MKYLKQIVALLQMSLGSISQRPGSALVTVVGIASVVGVLVALLSMSTGLEQLALHGAREDRVVVTSNGAINPVNSNLERSATHTIMDLPGIRKDRDGKPLATTTTYVWTQGRRKSDDSKASFPIFAVEQNYWKVFPEVHITKGRMFQPSKYELIAGEGRVKQFKGLEVGDRLHTRGVDWTIVGHFESGGSVTESVLIGDIETVSAVYKRPSRSTVTATLESPMGFDAFNTMLKANPTMDVLLRTESQSWQDSFKNLTAILNFVSLFIGSVMAIGATLGAINVMYSVVDGRKREMATLRALGFRATPIIVSVMIESLILAIPGALLGVFLAWLLFSGNAVSPSGVSFELKVTSQLATLGITWAVVMGLIGGLLPAIRAARVPVATALRST